MNFRTEVECLLEKAGKACQLITLELITKIQKLQTKNVLQHWPPRNNFLALKNDLAYELQV